MMQKKCWRCLLILALLLSACDSTGDEEGIEIVHYQGDSNITVEDGMAFGFWAASLEAGVVVLERYDDTGASRDRLSLRHVSGKDLPVAASYSKWQLSEPSGTAPFDLVVGTVAIQDWNVAPGGVVSGLIEGDLRRNIQHGGGLRTYFWAKLPE